MSDCRCDFRIKTVGDGCEICNPAKALQYAKETIAELESQVRELTRACKSCYIARQRAEDAVRELNAKLERLQRDVQDIVTDARLMSAGKIRDQLSEALSQSGWPSGYFKTALTEETP